MKVVKLGEIPAALLEGAELDVIPDPDGFVNVLFDTLKEKGPAGLTDYDKEHAVAVVDDTSKPPRIILLGFSESNALGNLAYAINEAFNEGEFLLDDILNAGGYPDFNEHDVLVGADFLLGLDEFGRRYTLHIDLGEEWGFEFRHVPKGKSITDKSHRTDKVPKEIYWKAVKTLAEAYFKA